MMNEDLKWIKEHYGEEMMQLCNKHFAPILEKEGLLPKILSEHFYQNKDLAQDIIYMSAVKEFKGYIFHLFDEEVGASLEQKSAIKLLDEAGYILFPECKSKSDIQKFRKFYRKDEELSTFHTDRLETCRVWFAVKKNVSEIKRENFTHPSREDEYGTSVISIQFTRSNSTLSIKNRYNHTIKFSDNTFNSDLDNITEGLAYAFYRDYGVRERWKRLNDLESFNYVLAQGKYYKYKKEINNIHYCSDNIIIDDLAVKKLPESQMLIDYFVFDFKNNTISCYDPKIKDSFISSIGKIESMHYKDNVVTIKVKNGSDILIKINDDREIISVINPNLTQCGDDFLSQATALESISFPALAKCGDDFLSQATALESISLPALAKCGDNFLRNNRALESLSLPVLTSCGDDFLVYNEGLTELNLPKLTQCGRSFMRKATGLKSLSLPALTYCDSAFLYRIPALKNLTLPSLTRCGDDFLSCNIGLVELNLPNLTQCGDNFLRNNRALESLSLPVLTRCGNDFLRDNESLTELNLPKLTRSGWGFLKALPYRIKLQNSNNKIKLL